MSDCTMCLFNGSDYQCVCPDNTSPISGSQRCNLPCTYVVIILITRQPVIHSLVLVYREGLSHCKVPAQ